MMERNPVGERVEWFTKCRPALVEDDPVEQFHEVTRWYPSVRLRESVGAALLERDESVQEIVRAAGKRLPHRTTIALPRPHLPSESVGSVILSRRSERVFGSALLSLEDLSALLYGAYGINPREEARNGGGDPVRLPPGRVVPSAGGLYPLDIYVVAFNVEGLVRGTYHYEPFEHRLEDLETGDPSERIANSLIVPQEFDVVPPEEVTDCSALFLFAAAFWRSRFKYGSRSYRFVLLEAGHAAQNLLLVAGAKCLVSCPIGGFYDRRLDDLLGLDSVNESVLYTVVVGSRP
jgi:SagB-type dehydrogenase family enzyme